MTVYGPDISNHNPTVDLPGLRALPEVFLCTHKISEGIGYTDPLAAGRSAELAKFPAAGFYHVLWPTNSQDNPQNQAAYFVGEIEQLAPWMFTHPCPVLQGDFELFSNFVPYRAPTIAECNSFNDWVGYYWRQRTQAPYCRISYAPYWLYGTTTTGLAGPVWASSYVGGSGDYRALYPGDHDSRWEQVPGDPATILQYSSTASFGTAAQGVDANGVRGVDSAAELQALLVGDDAMTTPLQWTDADWALFDKKVVALRQYDPTHKDTASVGSILRYLGDSSPDAVSALGRIANLDGDVATLAQQVATLAQAMQAGFDALAEQIQNLPPTGGGGPISGPITGTVTIDPTVPPPT